MQSCTIMQPFACTIHSYKLNYLPYLQLFDTLTLIRTNKRELLVSKNESTYLLESRVTSSEYQHTLTLVPGLCLTQAASHSERGPKSVVYKEGLRQFEFRVILVYLSVSKSECRIIAGTVNNSICRNELYMRKVALWCKTA